jgi:hypothetical protein
MNSSQVLRFSISFRVIAISIAVFFSGTLFVLPEICGGPGFLDLDSVGAASLGLELYLLGLGGLGIGVVLLLSTAVVRLVAPGKRDTPA